MTKLFLAVGLFVAAASTMATSPTSTIRIAHQDVARTALKGDWPAMERLMTKYLSPNFHELWMGKKNSRAQFMANIKRNMDTGTPSTFRFSLGRTRVRGRHATVACTLTVKGMMKGRDGKRHRMVDVSRSIETWSREGGRWKMTQMRTLSDRTTIDGKPVKAMM